MGCGHSKDISNTVIPSYKSRQRRIILLGTSATGKTTITKQIQSIYNNKSFDKELKNTNDAANKIQKLCIACTYYLLSIRLKLSSDSMDVHILHLS